jgi:hypothetical protein
VVSGVVSTRHWQARVCSEVPQRPSASARAASSDVVGMRRCAQQGRFDVRGKARFRRRWSR